MWTFTESSQLLFGHNMSQITGQRSHAKKQPIFAHVQTCLCWFMKFTLQLETVSHQTESTEGCCSAGSRSITDISASFPRGPAVTFICPFIVRFLLITLKPITWQNNEEKVICHFVYLEETDKSRKLRARLSLLRRITICLCVRKKMILFLLKILVS